MLSDVDVQACEIFHPGDGLGHVIAARPAALPLLRLPAPDSAATGNPCPIPASVGVCPGRLQVTTIGLP